MGHYNKKREQTPLQEYYDCNNSVMGLTPLLRCTGGDPVDDHDDQQDCHNGNDDIDGIQ